jgi:hypothetical protein
MTPVYKPGRNSCRITDQYFGKSQNTGALKFCLVVLIVENLDDPDIRGSTRLLARREDLLISRVARSSSDFSRTIFSVGPWRNS